MTDPPLLPHWQMMERFAPDLLEKVTPWRMQLLHEGVLPRKTKELMMMAMCAVIRFHAGFRIHTQYCMDEGATDEELFEACALSQLIGGVPAYRESVLLLRDILAERDGVASAP